VENDLVQKIKNNPSYKELIVKRGKFAWTLTIIMFVVYYAFILLIAFFPESLGKSMGGVMSVGIPVGMFIILFSFVMAGIYTFRANGEFDDLVKKIKEDIK
jgi:uncharacterized membrane protein (DUF485 family)